MGHSEKVSRHEASVASCSFVDSVQFHPGEDTETYVKSVLVSYGTNLRRRVVRNAKRTLQPPTPSGYSPRLYSHNATRVNGTYVLSDVLAHALTIGQFLGPLGSLNHRLDERNPQLTFFQLKYPINGAAGRGSDRVL